MKVIEQKTHNCKNCGAEVSHVYNHKCEYCGGMLDFNAPEEETIEVKAEDLVDIRLRDVMIEPRTNNVIMVFSGYKCPMPKVYEYDGTDRYVSKIEEYRNPPKCSICIELNKTELEKYGMQYVRAAIYNSGIRYNELDNVMKQAINNKDIEFICRYGWR